MLLRPVYRPRLPSLAKGLVGWWPFDDGAFVGIDHSGNNNQGTFVSNPRIVSGLTSPVGSSQRGAVRGDGSASYVNCGSKSILNPAAVTYAAWVNPASLTNSYNSIIVRAASSLAYCALYITSTAKLAGYIFGNGAISIDPATITISTNTWTHVVLTYDSSAGMKLYVNAVLDSSAAANGNIATVSASTTIGSDLFTAFRQLNGAVDDARIYNRALSIGEIRALYAEAFQPQIDIETIALMQGSSILTLGRSPSLFMTPAALRFMGPTRGLVPTRAYPGSSNIVNTLMITITNLSSVNLSKQVGKIIDPSKGLVASSSVSLTKSISKFINTITQSQSVTLLKRVGHFISFGVTSTTSLLAQATHQKTLTVLQTSLITLTRTISKVVQVLQPSTVLVTKVVNKTIQLVQTTLTTLTTIKVKLSNFSITQTSLVTISRSVGKVISISQLQSVVVLRSIAKSLVLLQTSSVSVVKQVGKPISILRANLTTLNTVRSKIIQVLQGQLVSVRNQITHVITIQQSVVTALTKSINKLVSITRASLVTLQVLRVKLSNITITQASLVTVRKSVGKIIDASSGLVGSTLVTLQKRVNKIINISSSSSVGLTKSVGKLLTVTRSSVTTLTRNVVRAINVVINQSNLTTVRKLVGKTIVISSSVSVLILKRTNKIITLSVTNLVTVATQKIFGVHVVVITVLQSVRTTLAIYIGRFVPDPYWLLRNTIGRISTLPGIGRISRLMSQGRTNKTSPPNK